MRTLGWKGMVSRQSFEEGGWIGQIVQRQIGRRCLELLVGVNPSGHCNHLGADGTGALHVERRIADDPDTSRRRMRPKMGLHGGERFAGHVIAVEMVIAEAAEREMLEEAVMTELDAGPGADVARQQ